MRRRATWVVLAVVSIVSLASLSGCDRISELEPDAGPGAEVVLHLDADQEVAQRAALLQVQLAALPALPQASSAPHDFMIGQPRTNMSYGDFSWPHTVSLPDALLRTGGAFWVEVSALDGAGKVLTRARLISAAQPGRVLEPTIMLSDVCLDVICGQRTATCNESGFCVPAIRAPESLPSRPQD